MLTVSIPKEKKNLFTLFISMQLQHNQEKLVVCFLLGNSPASEFYMPMFRNTLSVPSS